MIWLKESRPACTSVESRHNPFYLRSKAMPACKSNAHILELFNFERRKEGMDGENTDTTTARTLWHCNVYSGETTFECCWPWQLQQMRNTLVLATGTVWTFWKAHNSQQCHQNELETLPVPPKAVNAKKGLLSSNQQRQAKNSRPKSRKSRI